jgi:hypothetical protein
MSGDGAENAARRRDDLSHNWMEVIFLSRRREDWGSAMSRVGDPASPSVGTFEESDPRRPQRRDGLSARHDVISHYIPIFGIIADLAEVVCWLYARINTMKFNRLPGPRSVSGRPAASRNDKDVKQLTNLVS